MEKHRFRRPAMLDPKQAEEIIGDDDPAAESEIAHTSAWALLGIPSGDFDEVAVARLIATVREQGIDVVAYLWDRSPDFTLPGALWRIYLLSRWNQIDPQILVRRYEEGIASLPGIAKRPEIAATLRAIDAVLTGYATDDDLAAVLESGAQIMHIMAQGITNGPSWITDDRHALAYPVTLRPQALTNTADELLEGARRARQGTLS